MRVASWNVRSLRDDRAAVVAGLQSLDADVVCLQEVPRFLGGRASWHRLARQAGYEPVAGGRAAGAVAVLARVPVGPSAGPSAGPSGPSVGPSGPSAGLPARVPVSDARCVLLSRAPGLHQRGAVLVRAGGVTVATTHLDLDAAERLRHAGELAALLARRPGPYLVTGDLNEDPAGPVGQLLADRLGLQDVHTPPTCTFPASRPDVRIDAALTDAAGALAHVPSGLWSPATDHLPLVTELPGPTASA